MTDNEHESLLPTAEQQQAEEPLDIQDSNTENFPWYTFFIIGCEFCERFAYYAIRAILIIYLTYYLKWDGNTATAVFHGFTVLAYLCPLFGAIVADSWWGRYNVILRFSILYGIGMILMVIASVPVVGTIHIHVTLTCIGLVIVAFGTGGIKPCVSSFGADQFDSSQMLWQQQFFSMFYFAINAGSVLSMVVSPAIRGNVRCFGGECFAASYGLAAGLMLTAAVIFAIGTRCYRVLLKPEQNILVQLFRMIGRAVKIRWNTPCSERIEAHWLDYAKDNNNEKEIEDFKAALRVLVIFIPLPMFWALADQQGSRWTLQAIKMNSYVGNLVILPDQIQVLNPVFILSLIPFCEFNFYPLLKKLKINFSPLRRMSVGMGLTGLAFIVAALVQNNIDVNFTKVPFDRTQTSLRLINAGNCPLNVTGNLYAWKLPFVVDPDKVTSTAEKFISPGTYHVSYKCEQSNRTVSTNVTLSGFKTWDLIISHSVDSTSGLKQLLTEHPTLKSSTAKAKIGVINTLPNAVSVDGKKILSNTRKELNEFPKGRKCIRFEYTRNATTEYCITVKPGALYTLVLKNNFTAQSNDAITVISYNDVHYNDVNILWIIPQYFIITFAEVLVSISGLEFSYTQAPVSVKSLMAAIWLLTVSLGDMIVIAVAETRLFSSQAMEYYFFAGITFVATFIFIVLAVGYKYVEPQFVLTANAATETTSN